MSSIKVPLEVAVGLQAVRNSKTANMFDLPMVRIQAVALGYPEAADWIEKNTNAYLEGIHQGFEKVVDESELPIWYFQITSENLQWLEEERWDNEDGTLESNAQLLNRKLEKLRELEQQGF